LGVQSKKKTLFESGFGFVWANQSVGNVGGFIRAFRERLVDCRWQSWNSHIEESERFDFYRMFCDHRNISLYLSMPINNHLKRIMTRFRFGVSDIFVHYFRYRQSSARELLCPLCRKAKEDEIHFVLCCPVLHELRNVFIPSKYHSKPCLFKLNMLMSSTNETIVKQLTIYLYKAFKMRSEITA